jgi:succinylglutamate desuccinylase
MSPIEEIEDQMWKIDSGNPGSALLILGGTHGDERTGIEVVKKLVDTFQEGEKEIVTGTLYLALGNQKAIKEVRRFSKGGHDLNRMFSSERMSAEPDGVYEDTRARQLKKIFDIVDISIDIHATTNPSMAYIASSASEGHQRINKFLSVTHILTDPDYILGGEAVTTDEYVDARGGIGVCYETGWIYDPTREEVAYENMLCILRDQGMINDGKEAACGGGKRRLYAFTEAIRLSPEGFTYEKGMGMTSFQGYKKGEIIGYHGDTPLIASEDGVIVLPKPEEEWEEGDIIVYLARRTD